MQFYSTAIKNIEVHLPSGEACSLSKVIKNCPYTLDFNLTYFYSIIEAFVSLNPAHASFHFLLTRRVNELPSFKPAKLNRLIVFLLGDEWCRVPTYSSQVLAVFKCYGFNPKLVLHRSDPYLNSLILLQHLRVVCKDFKRWITYNDNVFPFPLGYFRQTELPIKTILARTCDVSFVGSIENLPNRNLVSKIKSLLKSPKTISRMSMVSHISQWKNAGNYSVDVQLTSRFPHADHAPNLLDYSVRLMNTKICLSPRGTSLETFRYFEALRYGCVLISEPVPDHWFYQDSPALYLNDWNKLPALIENLLADPDRLIDLHKRALDWWQRQCSPAAVASRMCSRLRP